MVVEMLKKIPEDVIESVRKANDIVDVVGEHVQLKKQGRNHFGLCPFHGEQTPSFSVTQEKQIFYCFGCKKGGNVFTFLMESEDYSFIEAVSFLAEKSGIELPQVARKQETALSQENETILSAHEWLTKLYHHLLKYTKDGKDGYHYLEERDIKEESIDQFQLGFAPNVKYFTADFLEKKGFHQQLLVKSGLLTLQQDNNVTDPFRGRVIFPIRNHLGKTVAFGGRAIAGQEPKYLNSSESDLFQKSRILYNFDIAKRHIRKESEAVLFEGQMDVISAYQAGVKNVIATLGTALSEYQAKLLKRYVDTVIICYDADHAGNEATFKAATLLTKVGCQVKVANLTKGMDPDSFIREHGADAFENEVIKPSDTYISFYMKYMRKDYNLSVEGDRIEYIQQMLKQLALIDSSVEREHYLKDLSEKYDLSIETLQDEILVLRQQRENHKDKSQQIRYTKRAPRTRQSKKLLPAFQNAERQLLAYMLQDKGITDRVQKEIGISFNLDIHKVIATYLYAFYEEDPHPNVSKFIERLDDDELQQVVIEIAMLHVIEDTNEEVITDYIQMIQATTKDTLRIKPFRDQQRLAEQQNDPIKAAEIAMQIIEIERQLKSTK